MGVFVGVTMGDTGLRGVCILAHFCEAHGPNFIFCTQQVTEANHLYTLIRDSAAKSDRAPPKAVSTPEVSPSGAPAVQSFEFPDPYASIIFDKKLQQQVREFAAVQANSTIPVRPSEPQIMKPTPPEDTQEENSQKMQKRPSTTTKKCAMCSSIDEQSGFLSSARIMSATGEELPDSLQERTYAISSRYPADTLFSIVRRISVRALSCEVSPGLEGPLVFSEAEGKFFALSYMFKVKDYHARGQQRCYSLILLLEDCTRLLSAYSIVAAHFRQIIQNIQAQAEASFQKDSETGSKTMPPRVDRRFALRTTRGMAGPRSRANLRSLTDLLGSPEFFKDLHLHFTHTLAVINSYMTSKSFGRVNFDQPHAMIDLKAPETALELLHCVSETKLLELVENVVIGNQIIVRAFSTVESAFLIEFFQRFLPSECCEARLYSEYYLETYECNFLGLPPTVELPDHISSATTLLVDLQKNRMLHLHGDERPISSLSRQLVAILRSDLRHYSHALLMDQIQSVVSEWRSKARAYYHLRKEEGYEKSLPHVLKVLHLKKEDLPALRFFTTGFRHSMLRVHLWQKIP